VEERDIGLGTVLPQNSVRIVMAKDILPKTVIVIITKEVSAIIVAISGIYLKTVKKE
jgi:hypothetical protein